MYGTYNSDSLKYQQPALWGLASTSLRLELTKPQQIFSTSAKLSSKSELVCFIREGQDKVYKNCIIPMQSKSLNKIR